MSGPKVVRIVTHGEVVALCEAQLRRLEQALARWQRQSARLGGLSAADIAAMEARHQRLHELLQQDRLAELQKQVPGEINFLHRDLAEREARAIEREVASRDSQRRLRENAATLLTALQTEQAPADLLEALEAIAQGNELEDAQRMLARGFALLTAPSSPENTVTEEQRELAQRLKRAVDSLSLDDWIAQQQAAEPRDARFARIDRHIAELQLLQGEECARPFEQRLADIETDKRPGLRNLLLDSLVVDLAQATHDWQTRRERVARLQELTAEIAANSMAEDAALLTRAAAAESSADTQQIEALIDECARLVAARLEALAAQTRRQAVLEGLASLGYEVREGMATAWADSGRVVLRKAATPGYGVELGGKTDNGRMQVRAVAFDPSRDKQRDRDIETIWCNELQRLRSLLKDQGCALDVERALAVGEVPLKEMSDESGEEERMHSATRGRTLS